MKIGPADVQDSIELERGVTRVLTDEGGNMRSTSIQPTTGYSSMMARGRRLMDELDRGLPSDPNPTRS